MRRRTLLTAGAGLAAAGTGAVALVASRSNREPVPHESVQTDGGSVGASLWLDGDLRDRDHAPDARWAVLVGERDRLESLVETARGDVASFLDDADLSRSVLLFLQAELPDGARYDVSGASRGADDRVRVGVDAPWPPTDGGVRTLVVRLTPEETVPGVDLALAGDTLPISNPAR
jgi:hypothetical protein